MTATAVYCAIILSLCAFALAATSSPPLYLQNRTAGEVIMSQYCTPPADSLDVHKFYCRMEG
jgi:hypothetical protein